MLNHMEVKFADITVLKIDVRRWWHRVEEWLITVAGNM